MTRTLNSPVDEQSSEYCYLYELDYSGGTLYITNFSGDLSYGGNTYEALGGNLIHEPINETEDRKAQGITLKLFAVDQTVISTILNNQFRNYEARIYLVHFDASGVMQTPDLVWKGRQYGDYQGTEDRDYEGGGACTLQIKIASPLNYLDIPNGVRCNVNSHNEMLRRAGQSIDPLDDFFIRIPSISGVNIYWGTETPTTPSWSRYGGPGNAGSSTRTAKRKEV